MTDPSWNMMPPLTPAAPTLTGDARVKSVIYVNNQLPSHRVSPVITNSPLISAISIALQSPPPLHLVSAYLPPGQAQKMEKLPPILETLRPHPVLVGMDSNLHHTTWNPPTYSYMHREAKSLIGIMNAANLILRPEVGVPTFIPNQARSSPTTADLQWLSPECYDWATVCKTDSDFTHSHFSDHTAIITELDLLSNPLVDLQPCTSPNWSKTDWEVYNTTLSSHLLPVLRQIQSSHEVDLVNNLADGISNAITQAITTSTPILKVSQRTRRWWCAKTLNPLKGHATNLRRRAPRSGLSADRVLYRAAHYKYQQACKEAKVSHWRQYLSQLSAKDIFTASGYTNGPRASRTLSPLRKPDGQLTSVPAEQADLLFQATGGPKIPCNLSDITDHRIREAWTPKAMTDHITTSINKLKLGKAPGADGITNQVIRNSLPELAIALAALLNLCVKTGSYPHRWKQAKTIILKKPGKPNYTDASAYRPIALLSCLSKVLEATLATHLQAWAEDHSILPEGHYGGRAHRSTTYALLNLAVWTKNQWVRVKLVGTLFVDVKAVFPTVVVSRNVH